MDSVIEKYGFSPPVVFLLIQIIINNLEFHFEGSMVKIRWAMKKEIQFSTQAKRVINMYI